VLQGQYRQEKRASAMLEKRFYAVPPQLLTTNGSPNGYVTIYNACGILKVKQVVSVTDTLGNLRTYEVKRIDEPDRVFLGPIGKPLLSYDDMSAYTTANGAFLFADEQQRTKIAEQEIPRAVYQEEPAVAIRSILVDDCGDTYGENNPLPVEGTLTVSIGGLSAPSIINTPAPTITEYAIPLPANTKEFKIKMRNAMGMKLAWVSGDTATNFITMHPGTVYHQADLKLTAPLNVYVLPRVAGSVIEMSYWT
jgi:hypothetical protein